MNMNSSTAQIDRTRNIVVNVSPLIADNPDYHIFRTKNGFNVSQIDSGIVGCRWHRIALDADIPAGESVSISFWANDAADSQPSYSGALVFSGQARDGYIDSSVGRYLSIQVAISESILPVGIKIYFPRITYLQYLPGVYSEDNAGRDFIERFLSLFESILSQTSETIGDLPNIFDPESISPPIYDPRLSRQDIRRLWLAWLARWVSIDLYDVLGEKGNRQYISKAADFFRKKGTLQGLGKLVEFLTGAYGRVAIKEYGNTVFRSWGMEHLNKEKNNMPDAPGPFQCRPFYKEISKTVDTTQQGILSDIRSANDSIHYVADSRDLVDKDNITGVHARNVIGIFVNLAAEDAIVTDADLNKIIKSFLPVFVKVKVRTEIIQSERYPTDSIEDTFFDALRISGDESYSSETGTYSDVPNWVVIHSNRKTENTNSLQYRVWHSAMNRNLRI